MATAFANEPPTPAMGSVPPPPLKQDRHELTDAMSSLGLEIPVSLVSLSSLPSPTEKNKKYSMLTDLIESEKAYVELLTGIIRKVAAAWSRSNLPPPDLDVMFRSVEGVYKTNRALLAKLKELGENPSSPKALGDLLMRWIDDLEQPYTTYANRYRIGFDDWGPVKSNPKLSGVLQAFSASDPPPSTVPQPIKLLDTSLWTLDALFLLPKGRLQYYRKLYSKLLKSTTPGRSDHRLLTGALGKLDALLQTLDERASIGVGTPGLPQIPLPPHLNAEVTQSNAITIRPSVDTPMENGSLLSGRFGEDSASAATSIRGSSSSRDERFSQDTALTSISRGSSQAMSSPMLDLEKRLATENTLDIFTMQPKRIRLQIAPPTLNYARELRLSVKVLVRFIPKATGVEVIHRHGHVYILSDLFLLCEEMDEEERAARGEDGRDMRLCYPPLSGKVLSVIEVPKQEHSLQVSILRRETLILETDSQLKRDQILNEFQECISFSKTVSRAAQEPVPPIPPPFSTLPQSQTRLQTSGNFLRERPDRACNPQLLPQAELGNLNGESERTDHATSTIRRALSTSSSQQGNGSPVMAPSHTYPERQNAVATRFETVQDSRSGGVSSPASLQRVPAAYNSGQVYPPRTSSASRTTNSPPSFLPGQIVPPRRSASIQSYSPSMVPSSDILEGQGRVQSPPVQTLIPQNSTLKHHTSMYSLHQQPYQHQSSLQSVPHGQNHPNFTPTPYPQQGASHFYGQPFPHSVSPPIMSHPGDQIFHKLQKSQSLRSLHSQYQRIQAPLPPIPSLPDGLPMPQRLYPQREDSMGSLDSPTLKAILPSVQMGTGTNSIHEPSIMDPSPPPSPVEERKPLGPVRSIIAEEMKCKVYQKQQHAQWKSLGSAHLTLYREEPTNVKQLVVEAGSKGKTVLISTIVLTDGVERVGKTGVAIELSDAGGARTGVIYMIQLRNEDYASRLFKVLLAGSDRAT